MFDIDKIFKEQKFQLLCKDDLCSVYQINGGNADGTVIYYPLYPGISLMYNSFHSEEGTGRKIEPGHYISIHHCSEGRMESETASNEYLYLEPGDILIENLHVAEYRYCSFPLSHYHGITINLSVTDIMESSVKEQLQLFSIDLFDLEKKFSLNEKPCIIHGDSLTDHIFSEIYNVPDSIKSEYLKIKILELLVSLKIADISAVRKERPYFYKTKVEKIKAIKKFITAAPEHHYTIEELARQFDISESSLKECFKGIYGSAIYTYMKKYRINMAATLLTETDKTVSTIAGEVGYSNSSKFAEAFKSIKGVTPLEYRKIKI